MKRKAVSTQLGTIHETKYYGKMTVIEYIGNLSVVVRFLNTGYEVRTSSGNIRKGLVKDRLFRRSHGIGFIGIEVDHGLTKAERKKAIDLWNDMLERCYNDKHREKFPTYKDCTVCDEWHNFQNFAKWFKVNYVTGMHLDKDIKVKGNKIYGPDTCLFVSAKRNAIEAHAKKYCFLSPCGEVFNIYNLADFCRKKGLCASTMTKVNKGRHAHHKGWTKA